MTLSAVRTITIAIGFLTSNALASTLNVEASSTGCFSLLPGGCVAGTTVASEGGLTFRGQSSISGSPTFSSVLGTFDLSNTPYDYNGSYFGLFVSFVTPDGAADANFTAVVAGKINSRGNGDVRITFDNPIATALFSGASGSGSLTLELDDNKYFLNTASHKTHAVIDGEFSGTLKPADATVNPTPEPATLVLFAGGAVLLTLGHLKRSRRRA